jgi:hypothetical protein
MHSTVYSPIISLTNRCYPSRHSGAWRPIQCECCTDHFPPWYPPNQALNHDSAFHRNVKSQTPDELSNPKDFWVGVLYDDKTPDNADYETDVLWIRCRGVSEPQDLSAIADQILTCLPIDCSIPNSKISENNTCYELPTMNQSCSGTTALSCPR